MTIDELTYKKWMSLIIDSLFLALKMNEIVRYNDTPINRRVTVKAWGRHWRRVKKAQDIGLTGLKIPNELAQ
jgi:hypothetical protein